MRSNRQTALRCWRFAALAVSLAVISGCLEAEKSNFVRYDASSDTFQVLTVFSHFAGETSDDLEHLSSIWNLRSQLIYPIPEFALFEDPAYIRQSDSEYLRIDLRERATKKRDSQKTSVSLNSLSIKPGRFFLSKADTLCYYHQISVPGKTLDAVLKELSRAANGTVVDEVNKELKRRRNGGKTISWDDFRTDFLPSGKQGAGTEKNGQTSAGPLDAMTDESLRLMLKQAAGGNISFRRQGSKFETAISLSEGDCRQAKVLIDLLRDEGLRTLKADPTVGNSIVACLASVKAERDAVRGLIVSIDIGSYLEPGNSTEPPLGADAEKKRVARANAVAFIRGRGIKIEKELTFKDIVTAFAAGTL